MEDLVDFWSGKRVFVTGHTGFKGAWLCLMLHRLGAQVTGFALPPDHPLGLFTVAKVGDVLRHDGRGDVRDLSALSKALRSAAPDIVFHMAAQALVHASYDDPVATFDTNVMGAVHLLEALRHCGTQPTVVHVTSDKCYDNREWVWPYRENEPMGGKDPYSASKGCAELITTAYKRSFLDGAGVSVATARAGNVIGGGDRAANRLIPDLVRSIEAGEPPVIRAPDAVRPWQHVLDPLSGYLTLAQALYGDASLGDEGWNFGPDPAGTQKVGWMVAQFFAESETELRPVITPHRYAEAHLLKLDSTKAAAVLGWSPRWKTAQAVAETARWYAAQRRGDDLRALTFAQIEAFFA